MTRVLALTGKPAVGKSTIVGVLTELGVPCKGTGDAVRERAAEQYDDPDEDDVWEVATELRDEHGPAGPTVACSDWIDAREEDVICVSDCRTDEEIEWLRDNVGKTLVVEIRAPKRERVERYVDMHVDDSQEHVSHEHIEALKAEYWERQHREGPYPEYDVIVRNSNSVPLLEVQQRFKRIVDFITNNQT
jgi:dephospho-CoA kinase